MNYSFNLIRETAILGIIIGLISSFLIEPIAPSFILNGWIFSAMGCIPVAIVLVLKQIGEWVLEQEPIPLQPIETLTPQQKRIAAAFVSQSSPNPSITHTSPKKPFDVDDFIKQ